MRSVVSFSAPGVVEVLEEDEPALGASEVRVRTLYSGISAGTELTSYRGSSPHLSKHWDLDRRLFADGAEELSYPVRNLGYEEVGEVVEVGRDADRALLGKRVWGTWGHRTTSELDA